MSVGEFAELAHAAIDALVDSRGAAILTGGTGLYLRAALIDLELPPAGGRGGADAGRGASTTTRARPTPSSPS